MYDFETIRSILLAGGASAQSADDLAQLLSLHYPEQAQILIEHYPGA